MATRILIWLVLLCIVLVNTKSLRNTALVIHALQGIIDANIYWNETYEKHYIKSKQDQDATLMDLRLTGNAMLSFQEKGLNAIRTLNCSKLSPNVKNRFKLNGLTIPQTNYKGDPNMCNVFITYSLWVGTNVDINYTMPLIVPRHISFYAVMLIASCINPNYTFDASKQGYVYEIAGFRENHEKRHYWMIYNLPELPNPQTPPENRFLTPVGIRDIEVDEGDHYLFWYREVNFH